MDATAGSVLAGLRSTAAAVPLPRRAAGANAGTPPGCIAANTSCDDSKSKPGRLSLKATATIAFSKQGRKNAPMMVAIAPGWRVLEETAAGVRDDDLIDSGSFNENVSMDGFSISGGIARGLLTATPITISWTSQEFDDDWIVTPDVKIEDLSGGDETEGGDE